MPTVESTTTICAPKQPLFDLAQDYYLRLEWDPFLREMKFLNGAKEAALGVQVWVKAHNGLTMQVEYISLQPPDRVAVKMVQGPFFFERFAGAWNFETVSDEVTQVRFTYRFVTRYPLLRPLLDPIIERVFLHDVKARLAGLKQAAEGTDILQRMETAKSTYAAFNATAVQSQVEPQAAPV